MLVGCLYGDGGNWLVLCWLCLFLCVLVLRVLLGDWLCFVFGGIGCWYGFGLWGY